MRVASTPVSRFVLVTSLWLGMVAAGHAALGPASGFESVDAVEPDRSGAIAAAEPARDPMTGAGGATVDSSEPAYASPETDPFAATYHGGDAEVAVKDPWQPFNRRMYKFNRAIDKVIFRPVAKGYSRFTPRLFRLGVSQFFDNLQEPVVSLNLLLQGKLKLAGASLGRFLLNTTLGLGGVLDPASHAKIPNPRADFGQTFAVWGWRNSRYVVLPLFGPATMRDTWGKGVNTTVSPIDWLARREGAEVSLLYGIDARASALSAESLLEGAEDEYAMVRDVYMQYRRCQIVDCSEELPDYLLPDYEFEIPDLDADTLRR